ncbi:MAG: putative MPP superfamily phosphohydrolase [Saprospiraceae bacterium]|jgi:predicted MPP superfamily phosphohydrolase
MIRLLVSLLIPLGILSGLSFFVIGIVRDTGAPDEIHLFLQFFYGAGVVLVLGALLLTLRYSGIRPIQRPKLVNGIIGLGTVSAFVIVLSGILIGLVRLILTTVSWGGISTGDLELTSIYGLLILIGLLFISLVHGFFYGKYRYKVEEVDFSFSNLPEAFDGFRLVQISDIHSGTWDNLSKVDRGVQMIQDQEADMIVFTGDLVNSDKEEINPFMPLFAKLNAPHGKYAILGNHDYYGQPRDADLRPAYYEDFFKKYETMGWDLLRNEHRIIRKNGSKLILAGVENWGEGRYFPKRGDLDVTLDGVGASDFCIMLSHDPSHWSHHILNFKKQIDLTLSGHTHGMQFGINLSWLRWSPIKWRYKNWIGRYEENQRQLYVNRGFGVLGFSGRVGMWPEITVITLRKDMSSALFAINDII